MRRVVAQGILDVLRLGHVHHLSDVASLDDELHVIIAHGKSMTHKPKPILDGRQRRDMVAAFDVIDGTHLNHVEDIFVPTEEIDPDVIVLGYDQHHGEDGIKATLDTRGIGCEVMCATPRELRHDNGLLLMGCIIDRVVERRC